MTITMRSDKGITKWYDFSKDDDVVGYHHGADIDLNNDVLTCDTCKNIVLVKYSQNRLVCRQCGQVYDPKFERLDHQAQESTVEDIAARGQLSYQQDEGKIRQTRQHQLLRDEGQEPEYILRERQAMLLRRPGMKLLRVTKG